MTMEWILLFPLAPMIYQDFKYRNVTLWQLLLFGIMQMTVCFYKYGAIQTGINTLTNVAVMGIISAAVIVYAYFRFQRKQQFIGSGDILFILLLAPYFLCPYFLHFLIISFLLALVGWWIGVYMKGKKTFQIPLVSYLGICYSVVVVYNSLSCL